jgi:glycosyltransferase involved in cell wall biosynthesis
VEARRRLRVAIDARALEGGETTGVGRYIEALLRGLAAYSDLELGHYGRRAPALLGPHLLSPLQMRRDGAGLIHGPANALPLLRFGLPGVVTVHDLAIYDHPDWFPGGQSFATRVVVPRSIRGAEVVVCPSMATRDAIARLFDVPPERCRVIPHGVESAFGQPVPMAAGEQVKRRYGLPQRYLLQVGTIQPRKNYLVTLRALARLPERERLPLIAVGNFGWDYQPVVEAVSRLGLRDHVRFVGYAGLADLPAIYQLAQAAVFPSLDEGFGLPVLEAFAAGTPLAASNAGAIPEVAGEAALLCAPEDDAALAVSLQRLLNDEALRSRLVAAGRQRAEQFSWQRSAAAHYRVYESLAA